MPGPLVEGPQSLDSRPRLAARTLTWLFVIACLAPLLGLSGYAVFFGRPRDAPLDVAVRIEKQPVATPNAEGAVLVDVIVIENQSGHELPNLTADINGQYFLHRQRPLEVDQRLVVPQQVFATKSNQRWVPGRYPIDTVTITAKLPSGRRGVQIFRPAERS